MKYSAICSFYDLLGIFDFLRTLTYGKELFKKVIYLEGNLELFVIYY